MFLTTATVVEDFVIFLILFISGTHILIISMLEIIVADPITRFVEFVVMRTWIERS